MVRTDRELTADAGAWWPGAGVGQRESRRAGRVRPAIATRSLDCVRGFDREAGWGFCVTDDEARSAARAAGRDAAIINSLEVAGFGWLQRTGVQPLTAELARYGDFVRSDLPEDWPGWLTGLFDPDQLDALETLVETETARVLAAARLAHGDLDVTHIYSTYQGIIDFGEMRGAELYFDLGHFLLHDGETRPVDLFDSFLAGYTEVAGLPDDHREAIRHSAILLGLRQLSLWLGPKRNGSPQRGLAQLRVAELANLLEGKPAAQQCLT